MWSATRCCCGVGREPRNEQRREAQHRRAAARSGVWVPAQCSTALHIQRLVDRFMVDEHRSVFGEIHQQTIGDLFRTSSLRPSAGLPWPMPTALPLNLGTSDRFAARRLDVPEQPILHILAQHGVRQQLRPGAHRRAVGMPLSRVSTVFKAAPTRRSIAPQFARDRRWRSTELRGNLSNAFATGTCQRDLFTLGEGKLTPGGLWGGWCKIGSRHTAALSELSSSDSWCHAGDCGCALAGVSLRNRLPKRPSLCAM